MILTEDDIRKLIKDSILKEIGFKKKLKLGGGGRSFQSDYSEEDENVFVNVPEGDYIHPILKNLDGPTPSLGSIPKANRTITFNDGTTKTANHSGYDIGMPVGYPIVSVAAGKVTRVVQNHRSAGKYIEIKHNKNIVNDNNRTLYMHLSKTLVKKGDTVSAGQLIAKSGNTGRSTGPHLHFTIASGPRIPDYSYDKAEYDGFFSKCKQGTYSKDQAPAVADEEETEEENSETSAGTA